MNQKTVLLILTLILFSGCATLPGPVDDVYLSEKTAEETDRLSKIGAEIIASNKEKNKAENDLDVAKVKVELSRKEISQNEAAGSLLLEKEKLYTKTNDPKLEDIKKQREQNNLKETQAKSHLDYAVAKMNETGALLEVRKYQLAVKVAELDYQKAMIAKEYQAKRGREYKGKKIDDLDYKKFLDGQKVRLMDAQNNYKKTSEECASALEKLKKSGYEGEI